MSRIAITIKHDALFMQNLVWERGELQLTDLCRLRSQQHYHVYCDSHQIARLGVFGVDVPLDLALFGEFFALLGLEIAL
jgi:hypothetical protein